jgi:hypothetical protein
MFVSDGYFRRRGVVADAESGYDVGANPRKSGSIAASENLGWVPVLLRHFVSLPCYSRVSSSADNGAAVGDSDAEDLRTHRVWRS